MIIDCDRCEVRGDTCRNCVVTSVVTEDGAPVDLDPIERRAIDVLAAAGLVPSLRLVVVERKTA